MVLKRLDGCCRLLVLVGCLDEIFFHRRPVLVGIEPQEHDLVSGEQRPTNCQGSTWFAELQHWTSLSYVTSDAGKGLQSGIAQMQQHRRDTDQVPLEKGLDVFHTKKEARRVLSTFGTRWSGCGNRLRRPAEPSNRPNGRASNLRGCDAQRSALAWDKATLAFQD